MSLAQRIRDGRYAKGWGPDELAQRADVSRTALYQIECGKTETPRAGTLRRIAEALDVPIERLIKADADAATSLSSEEAGGLRFEPAVNHPRYRYEELNRMFVDLLASPLGDGLARLVEDSHRLMVPRNGRQLG